MNDNKKVIEKLNKLMKLNEKRYINLLHNILWLQCLDRQILELSFNQFFEQFYNILLQLLCLFAVFNIYVNKL